MKKYLQLLSSKKTLAQALCIIVVCAVTGLLINAFHPDKVKIGAQRPSSSMSDTLGNAEGLPGEQLEVTKIDRTQLKSLLAEQNAVLFDARMPEAYVAGHIPDAINIPWDMLSEYYSALNSMPREIWVITYCDGPPCEMGELLGREMKKLGFQNVLFYYDGLDDWKTAREQIREGAEHGE